ncbi:uncharacterized protein LOC105198959 isoform X2 [Solenopsis invicta]|uniref:uncharacterized protein LOC105198959 isoform X2 n=1 Tax=Solenopsis invicta TaxID=13686 RepID=UPI00193CFF89|nr:uncharacterized protein LOC105198959 isoform X2 [Solenopsis invicta]
MGWYVVKFENEDAVEAVPKTWYSKDTKECEWPPSHWNSKKINDFIKLRKAPQDDWNHHKVVILGSYEDLSVAQRKANKAKHTSDLSSQNEQLRKQRHHKRGKTKKKLTRHLSDIESSDLSRSDSDTNIYPSPSSLITNDNNLVQNLPVESVTKLTTECDISRKIDTGFQKQVLKELNAIHLKLNDVMENVVHLFPVNEQTLAELEQWLNVDTENKKKLIMELSRVGGLNVKEVTRRIMYRVFTNEVGTMYSWEGAKKKKIFKNLAIASVILGAVRFCKSSSTEAEVISFIKAWLVRCKDRIRNATKNVNNIAIEENNEETVNETDAQV